MMKILTLAALLVTSASVFAFEAGMTTVQVNAEVAQRVSAGESVEFIAAAARAAGVSALVLQQSLIAAGKSSSAVFAAMVGAGFAAASMLPPTAGSGSQNAGNLTPGNGFNGFNNSAFGQSRATTVGGGGRSSVSRS